MTIRVRLLSAVAGTPAYAMGEVVDLPAAIAQAWIVDGIAELEAPIETAMAGAGVTTRDKGRR